MLPPPTALFVRSCSVLALFWALDFGIHMNRSTGHRFLWSAGRAPKLLAIAASLIVVLAWLPIATAQQTTTGSGTQQVGKKHYVSATRGKGKRRTKTAHSRAPGRRAPGRYHRKRRHLSARTLARIHRLHRAFVASAQLRPMAQQLIADRTPQAYAGVLRYARTHSGEAASAAYIALGQAYSADRKFMESAAAFQRAGHAGKALADYADYLGAQAEFNQQDYAAARQRLNDFNGRHPDSILISRATLLLANIELMQGNAQGSLGQLAKLRASSLSGSPAYIFLLGRANQLVGNLALAKQMYTRLYVDYPASGEATQVKNQLQQMGEATPFTPAQRIRHADGLYLAGQYAAAATSYAALAQDPALAGTSEGTAMLARRAVASYKQSHHVDLALLNSLPDENNDTGATRLYLSVEDARDRKDVQQVKALIDQMVQRFPNNRWTSEALFSAGNMALVANDIPSAIQYYGDLAQRFPRSSMASTSHWHAAWLNYRLGDKKTAAQQFDDQITRYPGDPHVPAAIYWRGVIYEEVEKNPAAAAACYQKLGSAFHHYYYAYLARARLSALHFPVSQDDPVAMLPLLSRIAPPRSPELSDQVPEDDVHVERANLLANAGLNNFIVPEIAASPDSSAWRAYAEAEIYSANGETWRSLHVLKQRVHSYFAVPISSIPHSYWVFLFPQPYWPTLQSNAEKRGLDPFLVASLIRQESEFNPNAISYANAWGLMQLLPRVGSQIARQQHVRPYRTSYLLNPDVNLKLGTAYLRALMDEFHDQPEYALAAYNAGDDRVHTWLANGPYASLPEFVESIPFTQTREYVQAILRNREIYRRLYAGAK